MPSGSVLAIGSAKLVRGGIASCEGEVHNVHGLAWLHGGCGPVSPGKRALRVVQAGQHRAVISASLSPAWSIRRAAITDHSVVSNRPHLHHSPRASDRQAQA